MNRVHLLSLGCPKNLADSEHLLKKLNEKGIGYSADPDDSDVLLINTCGFIEAAKRESIEEILRLAGDKGKGRPKKLLVFGCLAQRFGNELRKEIPEIDILLGVGEEEKIIEYCQNDLSLPAHPAFIKVGTANADITGREKVNVATRKAAGIENGLDEKFSDTPYAYLKIAEGCNRGCTYCVIPDIRGAYRSRPAEEILLEGEAMVKSGIKELILVAQDITSYGRDLREYGLSRLLREIAGIEGDFWVRLLYLHPSSITRELLATIASATKICNYIDMPLQHSEEKILKLMGRGGNPAALRKLVSEIRDAIPDVALRTTFITGFPQETESEFRALLDFIREMQFDRLGVFPYSKEEGTPAFALKGQFPKTVKKERFDRIMELQSAISLERNKKLVGRNFRALIDDPGKDVSVARLYSHAPEIDGVVLVQGQGLAKGDFVEVAITDAYDYDLKGALA